MPEYTLRIRRYHPESGEAAHWQDFPVELDGKRSVLDGILQGRDSVDGSIGIRCSCRAAICGSCGVRINGKPMLACNTHLEHAAETALEDGTITVEAMGNMPQSMACIQCGACVSDCLSMEVDPLFIGPAALAKAYRFVGDPRDGQHEERLRDLAEDPHGIYDCTHCFNCIEACPKGVAPMSQIMRLRRIAGSDYGIEDRNNGHRHEMAFVNNIERNGLLHEADLLPDSYGGKFHPRAVPELLSSLPVIMRAVARRKVTPGGALLHPHRKQYKDLRDYFEKVEGRDQRLELNLYITGY